MSMDFLPGFAVVLDAPDVDDARLDIPASAPAAPRPASLPTGDFRGRMFLATLSREQRQAVSRRARFHRLPWIRPATQPDADDGDELP